MFVRVTFFAYVCSIITAIPMHIRLTIATIIVTAAFLLPGSVQRVAAQIVSDGNKMVVSTDSVRQAFDNGPYFSLYKDNYFIMGTSVGPKPTSENTNVKFQISISQKLTHSTLPGGTYLFLFYSQKCFWNVLEKSFPMSDLNFNPGLGLAKPLFVHNRFIGKASLIAEHESNGKDGAQSRSWNRLSLGASIMIDPSFTVHGKIWLPFIDGMNNRDLLDYYGIYQMGTGYMSQDKRFGAGVMLTKRRGWKMNYNTTLELYYRIFKRDNQYLYVQYYNGYGEGLLDYNKFRSELRVGIVIKPTLMSDY